MTSAGASHHHISAVLPLMRFFVCRLYEPFHALNTMRLLMQYCSESHSIRNYIRRLLVSKGVSAAEWWPHSLKVATLNERSKVSEELFLGLDETTVKIPVARALSWSFLTKYPQLLNFSFDFDLILIIFSSLQPAIVMNLQKKCRSWKMHVLLKVQHSFCQRRRFFFF